MKKLIIFIFLPKLLLSQTLRINEFSNGPSGSKEWIELLVVPTVPTPSSLSGCFTNSLNCSNWIIDDNDGTFSPLTNNFGSGFATGHLRLKNVLPWNRLPIGALIVIYNDLDKDPLLPADDPYDFNNDCVYILPSSHSSIEYCTTAPVALTCSTKNDYSSCTIYGTGNWNTINLSNSGDAFQIRDASYNLIHGVVYGRTTLTTCGSALSMVGNSLSPLVSTTSGTNTFYAYDGLDLEGYFDASKWITGSASLSTPGNFNTPNNQIWIQDTIRRGCICDVTLNIDTTRYFYPSQNIIPFKVFQNKTSIVFNFDKEYEVEFLLYNNAGQMISREIKTIKGSYVHINPFGSYFLTVIVENKMGFFYKKTFKIFQ